MAHTIFHSESNPTPTQTQPLTTVEAALKRRREARRTILSPYVAPKNPAAAATQGAANAINRAMGTEGGRGGRDPNESPRKDSGIPLNIFEALSITQNPLDATQQGIQALAGLLPIPFAGSFAGLGALGVTSRQRGRVTEVPTLGSIFGMSSPTDVLVGRGSLLAPERRNISELSRSNFSTGSIFGRSEDPIESSFRGTASTSSRSGLDFSSSTALSGSLDRAFSDAAAGRGMESIFGGGSGGVNTGSESGSRSESRDESSSGNTGSEMGSFF